MERSGKVLLWVLFLSILAVISATGYKFLIQKDYDFVVEASCDSNTETCFYRDCSTGDCPPNGLEYYRVFLVNAADFESCSDNSCLKECEAGLFSCQEIMCGESEEDECSIPTAPSEEEIFDTEDISEES